MSENKFIKYALKPDLPATYKQRKFYRILSGTPFVKAGTFTRGKIDELIKGYPQAKIDKARATFKGQKRASKYKHRLLNAVYAKDMGVASDVVVTGLLAACTPESLRAARRLLRKEAI